VLKGSCTTPAPNGPQIKIQTVNTGIELLKNKHRVSHRITLEHRDTSLTHKAAKKYITKV